MDRAAFVQKSDQFTRKTIDNAFRPVLAYSRGMGDV